MWFVFSFLTALIWSFDIVLYRYAASHMYVEPVVFTCYSLIFCSVILLLLGGQHWRKHRYVFRRPMTWLYGITQIGMNLFDVIGLRYVSATEWTLLGRISTPLAIVFDRVVGRKASLTQTVLALLFIIPAATILSKQTQPFFIMLVTLLACALYVARTFIAELHPDNLENLPVRVRCALTGAILGICSLLVWICAFAATIFQHTTQINVFGIPELKDYLDTNTIFASAVIGITVLPAGMFMFFTAAKIASTARFTVVTSFVPIMVVAIESSLGIIPLSALKEQHLLLATITVTVISLLLTRTYLRKEAN